MVAELIGLAGRKQHGKDTTASVLARYGYVKMSFADPLREMAEAVDPLISLADCPAMVKDEILRGLGMEQRVLIPPQAVRYTELLQTIGYERAKELADFRGFLQRLGSEGVRDVIGPETWVELAKDRILECEERIVFADVRFPNEAEVIRDLGGVVWYIVRTGFEDGSDGHMSENALTASDADLVLTADSVEALEDAVRRAMSGAWGTESVSVPSDKVYT